MTVARRIRRRGERGISRKECRVISGVPVVTTLVCAFLFRTRGCGCIERPAFPAPSVIREAKRFLQNSGEIAPRDRGVIFRVAVIARSEATKQSTLTSRQHGLLRFARNDESENACALAVCEMRSPDERSYLIYTSRDCTTAASMNDANSGCGSNGGGFSLGGNCTPMNQGWSSYSTISGSTPSGERPEKRTPCCSSRSL